MAREKMSTSKSGGRAKQPVETNLVEMRKLKKSTHRKHRRKVNQEIQAMGDPDNFHVELNQLTGNEIW